MQRNICVCNVLEDSRVVFLFQAPTPALRLCSPPSQPNPPHVIYCIEPNCTVTIPNWNIL